MDSGINEILSSGGEEFSFRLNRKQDTELGPVTIDQWWMHVTQLYAQREHEDEQEQNHRRVLEFYWAKVREENEIDVRAAQERYLLGSLLPQLRSQGSRRIFLDATLRSQRPATRDTETKNLNELLKSTRQGSLSEFEFHKRSWVLLGRDEFPEETDALYSTMLAQLLDGPCAELEKDDCLSARQMLDVNWDKFHKSISRRRGKPNEKLVLDIFSYEARAAFHQCYSTVWCDLLPHLAEKYELNQESVYFLEFWHKDRVNPELSAQDFCFSLFHGHVFGLHPGLARFLLTQTGRELMGESLQQPESTERMEQLLNGFNVSLFDYESRRAEQNASRYKAKEHSTAYIDVVEAQQMSQTARRRTRPPADEEEEK